MGAVSSEAAPSLRSEHRGADPNISRANAARLVQRIRQVGVDRVLYGSDAALGENLPRDGWAAFRRLPLTDQEFRTIAANQAPYLR